MKKTYFAMFIILSLVPLFGQSGTTTTNNTIIIQGNVYYFKPATTPSSPQPKVKASDFIGTGSWYGEDAAKAWASISDWAIEHCIKADPPVKPRNGEIVYISSVHAFRKNTPEANKHYRAGYGAVSYDADGIAVYYWIVPRGAQMEDGRRETRGFRF